MNGTCTGAIFMPPPPWCLWEGPKGHISLNLSYKVNFKYFQTNLTNERYITYETGFSFGRLGHTQGWDLGVSWGLGSFFYEIQPDLMCELLSLMAHAPAQFFLGPRPLGP